MTRGRPRALTEEQTDEVVRRYTAGESILAIAVSLDVQPTVVRGGLVRRAVDRRGPGCSLGGTRALRPRVQREKVRG